MITTEQSAWVVQAVMAWPFLILGLSHMLQPKMWVDFFVYLHGLGLTGVLIRTFALELVPALVIVTFHWVWSGPAMLISIYGCLLAIKITLSLLVPNIGLKSLGMAEQHNRRGFVIAGLVLVLFSGLCFWLVWF